jgi:ribosome-binding protein aMBF1 (putative translation factor)
MKKHELNSIVAFDDFAEVAAKIEPEEWAFYEYTDKVVDRIAEYMEKNDISKTELAKRLGVSKARVTVALRGDTNLTFKVFTKILHVLDAKAVTRIVRKHEEVRWYGVVSGQKTNTTTAESCNPRPACKKSMDFEIAA